jgi:hypothetical protein
MYIIPVVLTENFFGAFTGSFTTLERDFSKWRSSSFQKPTT